MYPIIRQPIYGRDCVATSQPLATQAGLQMLAKGGNAVDAALACAIALSVVEPTMNGIGGDLFAIVHDGNDIYGLNGSGRAPKAWDIDYFKSNYGDKMPELGWDSVTVPGQVAAWSDLHQKFGKLDFAELFAPAIRYAREGFIVPNIISEIWQKQTERLQNIPDFADLFLINGRTPVAGQHFACPAQALALEEIAQSDGRSFYEGKIADSIIAQSTKANGLMTMADLAEHQSEWLTPLSVNFAGHHIHELPPNGQGIIALIALGILERCNINDLPIDSPNMQHYQIEAMKIGIDLLYQHIGDAHSTDINVHDLISDNQLDLWAKQIDPYKANPNQHSLSKNHGTVYMATADRNGMMVSLIQSNFDGFGSGMIIKDYGITLHNRGSFFSLQENHPNVVAGGKRPLHTIIPGFVTKYNKPVCAFGVMGATMQPQGHIQTLTRLLKAKQNPQMALDAPRWRIEDKQVWLEKSSHIGIDNIGWSNDFQQLLAQYGHDIIEKGYLDFGAGQMIMRLEDSDSPYYICGSESRRDGCAVAL